MQRQRRIRSIMLLIALVFSSHTAICLDRTAAQTAPARYTMELIGVLDGDNSSIAFAISAGGWVVGTSVNSVDGTNRVIRYRDGELKDRSEGKSSSRGFAINKSAQIAGFFGSGPNDSVAAVWDGSDLLELPTLGGPSAQAFGINDDGVVVGGSQSAEGGPYAACKWEDGEVVALSALGGASLASAINNKGQIVGNASANTDPAAPGGHATLWEGDEMTDLGVLGGDSSLGRSINDQGQVVGHSTTADDGQYGGPGTHAFLWEDGLMTDLGTLPGGTISFGWDINNSGLVAGAAENPATSSDPNLLYAAVLWSNGEIINLNDQIPPDTGWTLVIAYGINDAGQIVGIARKDGASQGFVLTPVGV